MSVCPKCGYHGSLTAYERIGITLDVGTFKEIKRPKVFGTNYFLKKDGAYLNGKLDKSIWIKWMELRVHGDVDGLDAAYGLLPKYEDLKKLFKDVLKKDYTEQDQLKAQKGEYISPFDLEPATVQQVG
jgi:GTP-dependent phosphoenolpyruvate carboxykinase